MTAIARDFGYSGIEWETASAENVKAVEAEYRLRLDGGYIAGSEIDQKARFVFTGLVGLITAILGWTFSHASGLASHYEWGLYSLAATFTFASAFAVLAIVPRNYRYAGATPTGLNITAWRPLVCGGEPDLVRLSGVRIKEYAQSISINEESNDSKSTWLYAAMICTVIAFPISGLVVLLVRFYPTLSNAAGLTLTSPVSGLWFFAAGLFIGGFIVGVAFTAIVRGFIGHWFVPWKAANADNGKDTIRESSI